MNCARRILEHRDLILVVVLPVALILRILGITTRYIWYDEAFSLLLSSHGPSGILNSTLAGGSASVAADVHPPLYYFLLNGWMSLFGDSVPAGRTLSILAGIGVVLVAYLLARRLFDVMTANIAALLVAVNPFQVHYSQEIRMYVFMTLCLLLATYSFCRGRSSGNWKWWALFALSSALAQYMHNLSAFYLIALALTPVFQKDWRTLKWVALGGFAALLLYLPWLIHVPAQLGKIRAAYWIGRPTADRFFTLLLEYVSNPTLSEVWIAFALFTALTVLVLGVVQTVRANRMKMEAAQNGIWLLYLAFAPPVLLFIFSQWFPVYLERALLPSGAIFCIWLAWALNRTRAPALLGVLVIPLLLVSTGTGIYQHLTDTGGLYGPFDKIDASLEARYQHGDVIVHSNKLSLVPAFYFDPYLPQIFIADPPGSPNDTLALASQRVLGVISSPDIASATNGANRVWFIIFKASIDEFTSAGAPTHPQLQYLEDAFQLQSDETWGNVEIYLFAKKTDE